MIKEEIGDDDNFKLFLRFLFYTRGMPNLKEYLESTYQVEDTKKRGKRKIEDADTFPVENTFQAERITKEKGNLQNQDSDETSDAWKSVETQQVVQENRAPISASLKDQEATMEVNEASKIQPPSESNSKAIKTNTSLELSTEPKLKHSLPNTPKGPAVKRQKQDEPVYRDRFGRKTNVKPISRQQQRKQNDKEREERIKALNRDEYTERLKELEKSNILKSNDREATSNTIKEEDPALMFNKSIKAQFANEEYKEKYVSVCGRKLFKDKSLYPPNRFGLAPGALWDGVDRGNGYERKWLDRRVEKLHSDTSKNLVHNDD